MATKAASGEKSDRSLRRDVGLVGMLFSSVGSIIGSGWLFGALYASQIAGPAALISWVIGGLMMIAIAMTFAELGTMFPLSGGVIRFPHFSYGSFTSFTFGWVTWLGAVTVAPIEVLATLQYATNYLPWLTTVAEGVPVLTIPGYVVAVALMFLYSLINVVGVRFFAQINNVAVWWKLGTILLSIVVLMLVSFNSSNFTAIGGFAPEGIKAVFVAISSAGIVFSYLGFRSAIEIAGESSRPSRDVPLAVVGSLVITAIIYVALQFAFIGALPEATLKDGFANLAFKNDFGPIAGLATLIGVGWLALILYIDAVVSPADTGLIYSTVTSRVAYAMGKNRNAPAALRKVSRRGVPWVSVLLTFIVGCLVFLPFPAWAKLVTFITSATVLSFGSGPLVVAALRRQIPDYERAYRLPISDVWALMAFYFANMIIYWAGWETNLKLFSAIALGFVVLLLHHLTAKEKADLELKAGSWVVPYLAGMALISWLGAYGGGKEVITLGWAFPVVFVWSLIIFVWALSVRLPPETVRRYIEEMGSDEEEEGAQPAPAG